MSELNERERNIVDLINNLSEVASDEATTQEAIDRILANIKQKTAENIKAEMDEASKPMERPKVEFPSMHMSEELKSAIASERMKMMHDLVENPPIMQRQGQLIFTRIREVKKPSKAHPTDAGIDFFVPDAKAWTDEWKKMVVDFSHNPDGLDLEFGAGGILVPPHAHVAIPSGIKTMIPQGLAMMMVNKSGIATKLKLDHSACLIDSEYRDELIFCFFNHGTKVVIEPGMKITQGLIVPVINLEIQEVLNRVYEDMGNSSDRGGGFGSSGSH